MNNNNSGVNTILIVIVIIILVAAGVWWYERSRVVAPAPQQTSGVQVNVGGDNTQPQTQPAQ